jgi:hypothetical protein
MPVFKIRWDDPNVAVPARESSFEWTGDVVEITPQGASAPVQATQDPKVPGVFAAPTNNAPSAPANSVTATSTGRARVPVSWRTIQSGATLAPDTEQTVGFSTRLRFSTIAFSPPFVTGIDFRTGRVDVDTAQIAALKAAGVDDMWLAHTIGYVGSDTPTWKGFNLTPGTPAVSQAARRSYLSSLVKELRPQVQLLVGYMVAKDDPYRTNFLNFLDDTKDTAGGGKRRRHAAEIAKFFASQQIEIDGICFNIEFDELKPTTTRLAALQELFNETSDAMATYNGIVAYATGHFVKEDGKFAGASAFNAQPFSLAGDAKAKNVIARAQFVTQSPPKNVAPAVGVALRKRKDNNGAGLHPSQFQCILPYKAFQDGDTAGWNWAEVRKQAAILRENRVGLVVYRIPKAEGNDKAAKVEFDTKTFPDFIRELKAVHDTLNPKVEAPSGTPGQPFQVPRRP